ncbi:major facilitator superfamily domain-containing protein [Gongronella butleri]|nr:major facilitator superfamily domain-containing protein [Gongronella butleri]
METTFLKLLYISLYALYGSAIAYIAVFYDEALQLSSQQIGVVLATPYFIQVVSSPLWTSIADRYPQYQGKLVAALTLIGGSALVSLLLLANNMDLFTGDIVFLLTLTAALAFAFFGNPVCSLVDSLVLKMLGEHKLLYGSQRLWGSISNGICILVVGIMITDLGIQSSFTVFVGGMVCLILLCLCHPRMKALGNMDHALDDSDVRQPLLATTKTGNYLYDPQMDASSRHQNDDNSSFSADDTHSMVDDTLDDTVDDALDDPVDEDTRLPSNRRASRQQTRSRRSSMPAADDHAGLGMTTQRIDRSESIASHANTILMDDEEDQHRYQHLMHTATAMTTSTTMFNAMDVQSLATQALEHLEDEHQIPSLGLALSYIPTIDTSLAAFGAPMPVAKHTLFSRHVVSFLLMVMLFGLAYAMIGQFLFLIYGKDLGMTPSIMGFAGPLAGIGEVLTFWFSKKLFDTYQVNTLILVVHGGFVLRNTVFMMLPSHHFPSMVCALILQALNGFCYALLWSTAVAQVDSFFAEDQRAMAQGILAAVFSGLGYGIGCVLSGLVYDPFGHHGLLLTSSCITILGYLVFFFGKQ